MSGACSRHRAPRLVLLEKVCPFPTNRRELVVAQVTMKPSLRLRPTPRHLSHANKLLLTLRATKTLFRLDYGQPGERDAPAHIFAWVRVQRPTIFCSRQKSVSSDRLLRRGFFVFFYQAENL
jgi:hypothetical protein